MTPKHKPKFLFETDTKSFLSLMGTHANSPETIRDHMGNESILQTHSLSYQC